MSVMRAVMQEVPEELLDERRRLGIDKKDELWDGVLHMVPPARDDHMALEAELLMVLGPRAKALGLVPRMEAGLFSATKDYRIPDLSFAKPEHRSERGFESAELVIEVLSPGDDSYKKLDWYARQGVKEMFYVNPRTYRFEYFTGDGKVATEHRTHRTVHIDCLDLDIETAPDEHLIITIDGVATEII